MTLPRSLSGRGTGSAITAGWLSESSRLGCSSTYSACSVVASPVMRRLNAALTARWIAGTLRKDVRSRTRRAPAAMSASQMRR